MTSLSRLWILLGLLLGLFSTSAWSGESVLHLEWPDGWEYREPITRASVVYVQARRRSDDQVLQQLAIQVIDTRAAQTPIKLPAIRELADRLRESVIATPGEAASALHPIHPERGFYFIVTRKRDASPAPDFVQRVDGFILYESYLILFTLATHDASDEDTQQMLHVLEHLSIAHR